MAFGPASNSPLSSCRSGASGDDILKDLFGWLPEDTKIEQVAVFPSHPKGRDAIAGGKVISVDEFMAEVTSRVTKCGPMVRNAISEQYPLLRTIQIAQIGYMRTLTKPS